MVLSEQNGEGGESQAAEKQEKLKHKPLSIPSGDDQYLLAAAGPDLSATVWFGRTRVFADSAILGTAHEPASDGSSAALQNSGAARARFDSSGDERSPS